MSRIPCPTCRRLTSQYHDAKGGLVAAARRASGRETSRNLAALGRAKAYRDDARSTLESHQANCTFEETK